MTIAIRLGMASVVALIAASSFALSVQWWDHNEDMYLGASVLLLKGKRMYADFAYFQMPYLPHIYRSIFALTGTTYYLLTARIVNWLFWIAAVILLFSLARRVTGDWSLALAACGLFATNRYALRIVAESSNYVVPLTLTLAALRCLLAARLRRVRRLRFSLLTLCAGVLAGLSIGTKLYYAAAAAPIIAATFFLEPGERLGRRLLRGTVPALVGLGVALLPATLVLARDPRAFYFNNLQYHTLATQTLQAEGLSDRMTLASKVRWLATDSMTKPSNLLLAFVSIMAVLLAAKRQRGSSLYGKLKHLRRLHREDAGTAATSSSFFLALAGASVAATGAAVLYMTPLYPQYAAMPLPYVVLGFSCLYGMVSPRQRHYLLSSAWLAVVLCLYGSGLLGALRTLTDVKEWPPICIHERAREIRALMIHHGAVGRVATLEPLFPLEAGTDIYPEFATGVFAYRVGERLDSEQRVRFVVPSPRTIGDLFERDPPAAVLITTYPERLQGPLRVEAEARRHPAR